MSTGILTVARLACAPATLLAALLPPLHADAPAAIAARIAAARPDFKSAVAVTGLTLDLGMAELVLEEGTLVPAEPVAGAAYELVFLGRARFRLDPPDAIEEGQLELFTGETRLDEEVGQMVLVAGQPAVTERLLRGGRPQALDDSTRERVEGLFAEWVAGPQRRGFGADAALLAAAIGDAAVQGYFAAWCRSDELGDFYYRLDPSEAEQVELGQFVPLDLDDRERARTERFHERQRRKGRFINRRVEDLGTWDTWLSSSLRSDDGAKIPGASGFETRHYRIDATVDPGAGRLSGQVLLEAVPTAAGRRAIALELFPDLEVTGIHDESGRELYGLRRDGLLLVVLAEPTVAGTPIRLDIRYEGVVLAQLQRGVFALLDTHGWYPHGGSGDRSTFDVTLRWPAKFELLASGSRVDGGEEKGTRWERRRLDVPSMAFSFEVGAFDVRRVRAGHVALTVAFSKAAPRPDDRVKREAVETVAAALTFFEETFGAYPLDELTVVSVPRMYSQGFLGFVTLSQLLLLRPGYVGLVSGADPEAWQRLQRTETIAHELSHQWWGNKVGWDSYRDQWLSEALAGFSAVLYTARNVEHTSVYLARRAPSWRGPLEHRLDDGRSVESLGPVVLGERLLSSRSDDAYQAIVYGKGYVVFSMLARALGEQPLVGMLAALADAANHRAVDTELFLAALERMSGVDFEGFAKQFVHGTGIPEIYYRFTFVEGDDGAWRAEGEIRQAAGGRYRYELVPLDPVGWDVRRVRVDELDVGQFGLVVPFQVALKEAAAAPRARRGRRGEWTTATGLGGNLAIRGEVTTFSVPLTSEPEEFWLDQRGEVLGRFFCESRQPKQALRFQALRHADAGDLAGAVELLRGALDAEPVSAAKAQELSDKELRRLRRTDDVRIRLDLARIHLDAGRTEDAIAEVDAAEDLFEGAERFRYQSLRLVLRSRIEIRQGDYRGAYDRLSERLYLDLERGEDDSLRDRARRRKFRSGRKLGGEAYALLAIAARETGREEVARRALEEAEARGLASPAVDD